MLEKTEFFADNWQQIVHKHLNMSANNNLVKGINYVMHNCGKLIRPRLMYALAFDLKQPIERLCNTPLAVELIHSYSLVHDDLPCMDNDDFRRGQPSCHKKFNEPTALLVGDSLLTYAFELISDSSLEQSSKVRCIKLLAKLSGKDGMILGQQLDLDSMEQSLTVEQINEIHRLKTGKLFLAAAEITLAACNIPKGSELETNAVNFANDFGKVFQIRDDLIDHLCDFQELGKTPGKDQEQNKGLVSNLGLDKTKMLFEKTFNKLKNNPLLSENNSKLQEIVSELALPKKLANNN